MTTKTNLILSVTAGITLFLAGCASDAGTSKNLLAEEFNMTLHENRIAFKSVQDYQKAVDMPSPELSKRFILAINNFEDFQSYYEYKTAQGISSTTDGFNDPYFESILNTDKVVEIGNYMYKINPVKQKVYVLANAYSSQYQDLVNENLSNTNIKVYTTEDNVLELVESGQGTKGLICGEGGIGGDADGVDFSTSTGTHRAAVDFNHYGIYYSLFARIWPSLGSAEFIFDFNGTYGYIHYHVRCGSTADYGTLSGGNQNANGEQRYQSWQGSTNLNNMFFAFSPRSAFNNDLLSRMVVIRKNW